MRIVIAPDAFKEALSAAEAAEAIARGWRAVFPDADLRLLPMADGGEGTLDALVAATAGQLTTVTVSGPLGAPVRAAYGFLGKGRTAVVEMARASGFALVPKDQRDPRAATTRGTGELISHALDAGAQRLIIGIGGSATNDGGAGMAQALGYRLLDAQDHDLEPGGAALARLHRIEASGRHPRLVGCEVLVACDVDNPLCGATGASAVYGPQKGATPEMAAELDAALAHFARILHRDLGVDVAEVPGAGAAGGLGAGLLAFASAALRPGVDLVADAAGLKRRMEGANLVLTGEGRMDAQSAHGKTPVGVARMAKEMGLPVVAFVGALSPGFETVYEQGIGAAIPICPAPMPLADAIARTGESLAQSAETAARLWRMDRRLR